MRRATPRSRSAVAVGDQSSRARQISARWPSTRVMPSAASRRRTPASTARSRRRRSGRHRGRPRHLEQPRPLRRRGARAGRPGPRWPGRCRRIGPSSPGSTSTRDRHRRRDVEAVDSTGVDLDRVVADRPRRGPDRTSAARQDGDRERARRPRRARGPRTGPAGRGLPDIVDEPGEGPPEDRMGLRRRQEVAGPTRTRFRRPVVAAVGS